MLTYTITTERDEEEKTREVDCHYFQDDVNFVYFKNGSNKTVLAVPTDSVVAIELTQEHKGSFSVEGEENAPANSRPVEVRHLEAELNACKKYAAGSDAYRHAADDTIARVRGLPDRPPADRSWSDEFLNGYRNAMKAVHNAIQESAA